MQTYFPAHSGSTSGPRRHPFREDLTGVSAGVHPPSETAEPGSGTQSASLAATVASGDASGAERRAEGPPASTEQRSQTRRQAVIIQVRRLVQAIRDGDDKMVEEAILSLSQRSRYLAPLAMVVGAFAMLFQGVELPPYELATHPRPDSARNVDLGGHARSESSRTTRKGISHLPGTAPLARPVGDRLTDGGQLLSQRSICICDFEARCSTDSPGIL